MRGKQKRCSVATPSLSPHQDDTNRICSLIVFVVVVVVVVVVVGTLLNRFKASKSMKRIRRGWMWVNRAERPDWATFRNLGYFRTLHFAKFWHVLESVDPNLGQNCVT